MAASVPVISQSDYLAMDFLDIPHDVTRVRVALEIIQTLQSSGEISFEDVRSRFNRITEKTPSDGASRVKGVINLINSVKGKEDLLKGVSGSIERKITLLRQIEELPIGCVRDEFAKNHSDINRLLQTGKVTFEELLRLEPALRNNILENCFGFARLLETKQVIFNRLISLGEYKRDLIIENGDNVTELLNLAEISFHQLVHLDDTEKHSYLQTEILENLRKVIILLETRKITFQELIEMPSMKRHTVIKEAGFIANIWKTDNEITLEEILSDHILFEE